MFANENMITSEDIDSVNTSISQTTTDLIIPQQIANFTGILELKNVRSFMDANGTSWFVLNDLCAVLGIANPWNVFARLHNFEKGLHSMETLGGPQQVNVVNEGGLYHLLGSSRKPEAQQFLAWIHNIAIPKLRLEYQKLVSSYQYPYPPDYKSDIRIIDPWILARNQQIYEQYENQLNKFKNISINGKL